MYLKRDKKKNGRVYLSITGSYRNAEGIQRNRVIKSLGYLDDLERKWGPDALVRCEAIRDELTAEAKERNTPQTLTIHPAEKVDMRMDGRKNIGIAVPLAYYNLLGTERVLRNACRSRRIGFDCNAVELAASPAKYDAQIHYGAAKYLDGLAVDPQTGELLDTARAVVFDEAKLEAERRLDGYYVIITSATTQSNSATVFRCRN